MASSFPLKLAGAALVLLALYLLLSQGPHMPQATVTVVPRCVVPADREAPSWPTKAEGEAAHQRFWARVGEVEAARDDPGVIGCNVKSFSKTLYGEHRLCEFAVTPARPCIFHSYGVGDDWTMDDILAAKGCEGTLFDPTVELPLHPGGNDQLTLFRLGAPMMPGAEGHTEGEVPTASVVGMAHALGHPHLDILKMDCEGCEFAIAKDIFERDPFFLERVDQFALEIHFCRTIMPTENGHYDEARHNLNALFVMLERAGHVLRDTLRVECGDTAPKIMPPLGSPLWKQDKGCCHNYAWSRVGAAGIVDTSTPGARTSR